MERFFVIGGIIIQSLVTKKNRFAGAIIGFLVTIFLFIWGSSVYSRGGSMEIFTIELSAAAFYVACAIWLAVDIWTLIKAKKSPAVSEVSENAATHDMSAMEGYDSIVAGGLEKAEPQTATVLEMGAKGNNEALASELRNRFENESDTTAKKEIARKLVELGFLYYSRYLG